MAFSEKGIMSIRRFLLNSTSTQIHKYTLGNNSLFQMENSSNQILSGVIPIFKKNNRPTYNYWQVYDKKIEINDCPKFLTEKMINDEMNEDIIKNIDDKKPVNRFLKGYKERYVIPSIIKRSNRFEKNDVYSFLGRHPYLNNFGINGMVSEVFDEYSKGKDVGFEIERYESSLSLGENTTSSTSNNICFGESYKIRINEPFEFEEEISFYWRNRIFTNTTRCMLISYLSPELYQKIENMNTNNRNNYLPSFEEIKYQYKQKYKPTGFIKPEIIEFEGKLEVLNENELHECISGKSHRDKLKMDMINFDVRPKAVENLYMRLNDFNKLLKFEKFRRAIQFSEFEIDYPRNSEYNNLTYFCVGNTPQENK